MNVPYRTLHRFAAEQCGFGHRQCTLRVADGEPGVECQVDLGQLGQMLDPQAGRRRALHALIFTAVFSRHMIVHLSVGQTLADVIVGCARAWELFGGTFKVLVPDSRFSGMLLLATPLLLPPAHVSGSADETAAVLHQRHP